MIILIRLNIAKVQWIFCKILPKRSFSWHQFYSNKCVIKYQPSNYLPFKLLGLQMFSLIHYNIYSEWMLPNLNNHMMNFLLHNHISFSAPFLFVDYFNNPPIKTIQPFRTHYFAPFKFMLYKLHNLFFFSLYNFLFLFLLK